MLDKTLQMLLDRHLTSVQEVADLSGVAPSTVYRWISGESEPDFRAVRALLRGLPAVEAQRAILSAFTAGSHWSAAHAEEDLDINHDGKIDVNDALDASIAAVQAAGESLRKVREGSRDDIVEPAELADIISRLNEVVRDCTVVQRVLTRVSETRRKAR